MTTTYKKNSERRVGNAVMTRDQVCQELGISLQNLMTMMKNGEIPYQEVSSDGKGGTRDFFLRADIEAKAEELKKLAEERTHHVSGGGTNLATYNLVKRSNGVIDESAEALRRLETKVDNLTTRIEQLTQAANTHNADMRTRVDDIRGNVQRATINSDRLLKSLGEVR